MTIHEMQNEIHRLKKENDVCILAHSYQGEEICDVADFVGDSFGLSVKASKTPQKNVLMCGVRFMAETVKILSPDKKVVLVRSEAGCPMAEQMDKAEIEAVKQMYPGYAVVAYINTTSELKTVCDVCVTSSSAVKIVKALPNDKILFIPDCNLGDFVARSVPEKEIKLLQGGCPTHARVSREEAEKAKALHPKAKLLVHPECKPAVVAQADFVGSTTAIIDYVREHKDTENEFIIGTELSIAEHLSYEFPDKSFYPLSKDLVCHNMKITTLPDVYRALKGLAGEEITLPEDTLRAARACIDRMIELG